MKLRNSLLTVALIIGACKTIEIAELRYDEKLARLMKLEDERSSGAGELLTRFSEREPQLRRRAALAAGRIGDSEAASSLADLLNDPEETVRITAAFALGLLDGDLPPDVQGALELALSDPSEEVRARVIEAMGRKGTVATENTIGSHLLDRLPGGPPPQVWGEDIDSSSVRLPRPELRLGLFALSRLESLRWTWNILATEESHPRFLWWPAAWTASRIRAEGMSPLLLQYAGSGDPYFRLLGARGLAGLTPDQSRNAVLALLDDPEEQVRIEAVRAAAALELNAAIPKLVDIWHSDSTNTQIEALKALSVLPDAGIVESLIDRLHDPSPRIRAAVLRALAFQDRETFWLLLAGMDPDPNWMTRADFAGLLGELKDPRSLSLLRQLASDRDFRVRPYALRALTQFDPERATPILIEHLTAEDPFERAASAEGLGRIGSNAGIQPLVSAWDISMKDKEPDARMAILSALDAFGAETIEPIARRALTDPSWPVRKRAQDILRKSGHPDARAAEVGSGRYLNEYLKLLRPEYTPHAYIRTEKGAIEVELFILDAPMTVDNFMRLAREGFYDGLTFHQVMPNGYVQAGDPRGDGNGGPGYTIRSEVNLRSFLRGTLGMVSPQKDMGGSQFFITHLPQPQLDGEYTAFGQVISGMEIVDYLVPGDVIREIAIWDGVTPPEDL
jgi:cyclophilin family peptidyl-prolyl cis-trans isomerase